MLISIINNTNIHRQDIQDVLRSVNRQLQEDFRKYWHTDVELRLEGWTGESPDPDFPLDLRGDAIIYLWDEEDIPGALGYHSVTRAGLPFGFVFTDLADELGEPWSVTLSHEALKLAIDPEINRLVQGPHPDPDQGGRTVYHWYELCDAVQAQVYDIDGVTVSNFVLPLYFTEHEETANNHNDFLGLGVDSFGVAPGGYVGFFDPQTGDYDYWLAQNDLAARTRQQVRERFGLTRRTARRQASDAPKTAKKSAAKNGGKGERKDS